MRKIKELFNGEHGTFFKFLVFALTLFVILWFVGPGNTVIHWAKAKMELKRQNRQMEMYQEEIDMMRRQIDMLESDRDTLEKFAREKFYFSVPGEDVYIIEND